MSDRACSNFIVTLWIWGQGTGYHLEIVGHGMADLLLILLNIIVIAIKNAKFIIVQFEFAQSNPIKMQEQIPYQSPTEPRISNDRIFFKTDFNALDLRQTPLPPQPSALNKVPSQMSRGSSRTFSKIEERMMSKLGGGRKEGVGQEEIVTYGNYGNIGGEIVKYETKGHDRQIQFSYPEAYEQANRQPNRNLQQNQHIKIEKSLVKPKFGFKFDTNQVFDDTLNSHGDVISFDSSSIEGQKLKQSKGMSLNGSKSASNFSQILRLQQSKVNVRKVKNGEIQGYMLSKIDKKQQNIKKRLLELKKNNQAYDNKIKQKQREIDLIKKRMQKQQKQLNTYQSKMVQAYDNIGQDQDSLLLSSRNYEIKNEKIQSRTKNKSIIGCTFQGMPKKLCRQILYGKCMILESDLLQIGFDNKVKPGLLQLYLTIKQNIMELGLFFENVAQNGYKIDEEHQCIDVRNIPAGKKIKLKVNVEYTGTLRDRAGLMMLRAVVKINSNSIFTENVVLPFCLYRNFVSQPQPQPQIKSKTKLAPPPSLNYNYKYITKWQNSCDQFIKNPKNYLESLFKTGKWIDQDIYHLDLIYNYKNQNSKSMNIVINCRNFAIEMDDTKYIDVAMMVGNFLARPVKDKDKIDR